MILSLFLFNAVYAQDGADESLGNDDNRISLQGAGCDFASVQTLIDCACDGDTIELKNSTYFGNGTPISIDKSITINGNDALFDAQCQSGIFKISKGSNVALLNLTLINAKEDGFGSAIQNHGVLTIWGCNLNSNNADCGVIYNDNVINVYNSNFSSNSADFGGVVYNDGFLSIESSKFTSNNASDAAAICSFSELMVLNCEFQKNTISHSYGVIYVAYGNADVGDCLFKNNKGSDEGCCIFVSKPCTVHVKDSRFIQNTAYSYAGAIDNSGNLLIDTCSFDKNSAWGAAVIDNGGTLTILNSNFTRNSANRNGGAIDTKGEMKVVNCIFQGNAAGNEGGAMIFRGDANVTHSSFIDNHADVADAIYINDDVAFSINDNWWGSDEPDFSKLLNVDLSDDFTWIAHESKIDDANATVTNGTGNQSDVPAGDGESQTDAPVNDAENQGDVPVDAGNKPDYMNNGGSPISMGDMAEAPEIRHVEAIGNGEYSKDKVVSNFIPQLRQIQNLNVKATIDNPSKVGGYLPLRGLRVYNMRAAWRYWRAGSRIQKKEDNHF